MRSCGPLRLFSPRSSTAPDVSGRLCRSVPFPVRGRADLPGPAVRGRADRPEHLLRGPVTDSDAGSQYLAICYTARLQQAGITASVGTPGSSYDNALAETIIGLYKAELIYHRGPWDGMPAVRAATARWVAWFNHRRLYARLGYLPPAQYEAAWHASRRQQA